jgi:hypothetical protein
MSIAAGLSRGRRGLLAAARTHVINRPRVVSWMRRVFAGSYAVLAGRLALSDR